MYTFKEHLILEATMSGEMRTDAQRVIASGLSKMLKMDAPESTSDAHEKAYMNPEGRVVDSWDMIEALEVIRGVFDDAKQTHGTPIETQRGTVDPSKGWRKGDEQMDIVKFVKDHVHTYFMVGGDDKEGMLKRRKYRQLIMLVLNPFIELFKGKDPQDIWDAYNEIVDFGVNYIHTSEIVSHPDDAFVARKQISREIQKAANIKKATAGVWKLRKASMKKKKTADVE